MFEEIAPRRNGAFLYVFLTVVFGFVALSLPNWLEPYATPFDLPYAIAIYEFLIFAAMAMSILRVIRSFSVEYKYILLDATLTIKEKVGSRETSVQQVTITAKTELVPFSQGEALLRPYKHRLRRICYGVSDKKSAYLITFPKMEGDSVLIFQPSPKFVELLQQIALDKRIEM